VEEADSRGNLMENGDRVTIPVYLVYGSKGERLVMGEAVIDKQNDEFTGTISFEKGIHVEAAMDTARSITNQSL
jgi:hypothetical protein